MELEEKISRAKILIDGVMQSAKNPIIACSFGKDSMVMLDLIRRAGYRPPVLFHKEPFFPKKLEFANRVISDLDLIVYDYPPSYTAVSQVGEKIEIMNFYSVGRGKTNRLPTGVYEPMEPGACLCGYDDLYAKPTGGINYPWEALFIGHKTTDNDFLMGPIPIAVDSYQIDSGPLCVFPIRLFTDEDIWNYIALYDVPYNEKRYDKINGYGEFSDRTFNNDWYPACTRCMDLTRQASVFCPKDGREIENRCNEVRRVDAKPIEAWAGEK